MNGYKNRSTMTKLMAGFALVAVLMAAIGWVGLSGMGSINDGAENIYEVSEAFSRRVVHCSGYLAKQ